MKNLFKYLCMIMLPILMQSGISAQIAYFPGKVELMIKAPSCFPLENRRTNNILFNQVLDQFEVSSFIQTMSFARTESLRRVFQLSSTHSEDSLFNALEAINGDSLFESVSKMMVPVLCYNPADYMWTLTLQNPPMSTDWLWSLKKIQADLAWDITKGDPDLKVAIVDEGVDPAHPDLINKLDPAYDFYTGNPFTLSGHGTSVATILGAETVDQGQTPNGQMASIGYRTKMMLASFGFSGVAACVKASTVLHAKILSISWYYPSCAPNAQYLAAEQEILNNGTTIIRAAGNGTGDCGGLRLYPFSGYEDPRTIVVTSTYVDDRHYNSSGLYGTNSHYPEVDLCAPGYCIMGGTLTAGSTWPYFGCWGGTSQSTPIVAGLAALMHAVNPCLTPEWDQDILKYTGDPIVDAANFPGVVGTGRINAYKAVVAAQGSYNTSLDLYIKDRTNDFGYPGSYVWGWYFDKSPDIWCRNQPDGLTNQIHQEPEYQSNSPVYVYVRVWNKSCVVSAGDEQLSLYWSKGACSSSWPQNWDGTQPTIGDVIGTLTIPALNPGESTILQFTWTILNPYIYQNWESCLLARIEGVSADPITIYPYHLENDVFYNNNIALHNVTITDIIPGSPLPIINGEVYPHGKYMFIGNSYRDEETFDLHFDIPDEETGKFITSEAEVKIIFDSIGWQLVSRALQNTPGIKIIKDRVIVVYGEHVTVANLVFPAQVRVPIYVGFSFLTDEMTEKTEYGFDVSQRLSSDHNHLIGAVHHLVRKYPREAFQANAGGDKIVSKNETIDLVAQMISECAIYNWYDPEGNLIYTGNDLTVSTDVTKRYKLEVIANSDGFKDYDSATIIVRPYEIISLYPNPTSSQFTVNYDISGANSAYIMILNSLGTISYNYILNTNTNSIIINASSLSPGIYSIILVCNGAAVDMKQLSVD